METYQEDKTKLQAKTDADIAESEGAIEQLRTDTERHKKEFARAVIVMIGVAVIIISLLVRFP